LLFGIQKQMCIAVRREWLGFNRVEFGSVQEGKSETSSTSKKLEKYHISTEVLIFSLVINCWTILYN